MALPKKRASVSLAPGTISHHELKAVRSVPVNLDK